MDLLISRGIFWVLNQILIAADNTQRKHTIILFQLEYVKHLETASSFGNSSVLL